MRAVSPSSWTHTRAINKGQGVRRMGEHTGVRRAPCSWAVGKMAPCRAGAAGATEDRDGDDAGAHARHMRRRTSGWCQLTFPPRSISRLSSASSPSPAASYNFSALERKNQPMCCAVSAAREGRPTSSLTRNRSETVRLPRSQRCEACHMLREGASRQTAGLPSWPQGPIPCSTRAASRPGSRVGRKGQRARPMRASANTSTPWRHSHVPLDRRAPTAMDGTRHTMRKVAYR
jgi:hypothetical protein